MRTYNHQEAQQLLTDIAKAIARVDGYHDWRKVSLTMRRRFTQMAEAAVANMPPMFVQEQAVVSVGLLPSERKVQVS